MHRVLRSVLLAACPALLVGCGGGVTVLATTPVPDAATSHPAFAAPASALGIEPPKAAWSPAMYGDAGQGKMLAEALAARTSAMIIADTGLDGATWEERIVRMVKAASPNTAVVARARGTLDKLLEERGEIPYRVTEAQGGVDAFGQPYYVPREHPLSTEWLLKKKALKGADAMLTVRRVTPDVKRLEEMRRAARGGCGEALAELGAERERAVAYFGDLVRQADDALDQAFSRQLEKALPFLRAELERRLEEEGDGPGTGCAEALLDFVKSYEPCAKGSCALGPRFDLAAGGIIAMDDGPASALPPRCAEPGGRDYVKEIREAAGRAAAGTFASFPQSALGEIVRFAAFDGAVARFADFCAVRHRRFTAAQIASFGPEVGALFESLGAARPAGEIAAAEGLERIPGLGPVRVLARVLPTGTDPRSAAAELFDGLEGGARCTGGTGDGALQTAVIDVGTSEVAFMGLFFEEQLLCEDLAPGQP
jgi:hypothetical protein